MSAEEIESLLLDLVPQTVTFAFPEDLGSAVRGGRVPAWLKSVTEALHVTPVLRAKQGRLGLAGVSLGRGAGAPALARRVLRRMKKDTVYRVMIAHADSSEKAHELRRLILAGHAMIHSCHLAEAGPALGVHLGRGGIIVAFLPQPEVLS